MSLQTLSPDESPAALVAAMEKDGACIVRDVLPPFLLDRIHEETAPWIERSRAGGDDFTGRLTRRTGALIARAPSTREVITHPLVLGTARAFLGPYCQTIQLHLTQTICILPGQAAQVLHRDRLAWGGFIPLPIEPQFNTIWALTDFTEQNGATRVVPGSHAWPLDRNATSADSVPAAMSRGSVLLYSGTVIHGGGENQTEVPRIGMNITYCLAWLRQEENQFLSCPPRIAKDLDPELTDLMGYTMGSYALGYYSHPEMIEGLPDTLPPELALGRRPRAIPGNSMIGEADPGEFEAYARQLVGK